MKIEVFDIHGKGTGRQVDLPDNVFGLEPNEHAVYLACKSYLANQRQGTHKAKERGEIKGSTRKIKKQKGTGTARAGSIKNPLFRGGGRVFGPRPRSYSVKLTKKVARLARGSAFSAKTKDGSLKVVEDFTFDNPQTKAFATILTDLDANGKNALLITADVDKNIVLSSRNISKAEVKHANEVCTYDVIKAKTVLVSEGAIQKIKETFGK
ncbi:MAG: 50S ribosomal protein L4 [Saprospiraceae bacterium]|nr:50S ribosomal protein L4 [Saprospiraceae bacterium]